jgi:hypothetical protein
MLDTHFRHYCRNPRCRVKLSAPAENPRRAFCTPTCLSGFYRSRCVVCERELPPGPANRRVCRRTSCRAEVRRFLHLYALENPETAPATGNVERPSKTSIKSLSKMPVRTWGPSLSERSLNLALLPLDPDTAARVARANDPARLRPITAWGRPPVIFGPNTPPLNLIGGHRFAGAPDEVITRVRDQVPRDRDLQSGTIEGNRK